LDGLAGRFASSGYACLRQTTAPPIDARPSAAIARAIHDASLLPVGVPDPVRGSVVPAPVPTPGRVAVAAACVAADVLVAGGVLVGVHVGVAVQVGVAEAVNVAVGVVGVDVAVGVPVIVAVGVEVAVLVPVGVGVGVFVPVGVAVFVDVGVLVTVAVSVTVGVFVRVGVELAAVVDVGVRPVQSANATPPPPGNITRAAIAIDSATERLITFSISGYPRNSVRPCTRALILQLEDHNSCNSHPVMRDCTTGCAKVPSILVWLSRFSLHNLTVTASASACRCLPAAVDHCSAVAFPVAGEREGATAGPPTNVAAA
jgi:hypothetical protein